MERHCAEAAAGKDTGKRWNKDRISNLKFEIYQPKTLNLPVAVFVPFNSVGPAAVEVVAPAFILPLVKPLLPFHAMAGAIAFAAVIVIGGESQTGEAH